MPRPIILVYMFSCGLGCCSHVLSIVCFFCHHLHEKQAQRLKAEGTADPRTVERLNDTMTSRFITAYNSNPVDVVGAAAAAAADVVAINHSQKRIDVVDLATESLFTLLPSKVFVFRPA